MSINVQQPVRRRHAVEVDVAADAGEVFALMCPVREYEWVEGWKTNAIWSSSGLVEDGCIFTTPLAHSQPEDNLSDEAVWVTTLHDPENKHLEMIKVAPRQTVTRLQISVAPTGTGSRLSVAYELAALSDAGREMVAHHTAEGLEQKIRTAWKPAIERTLGGASAE